MTDIQSERVADERRAVIIWLTIIMSADGHTFVKTAHRDPEHAKAQYPDVEFRHIREHDETPGYWRGKAGTTTVSIEPMDVE